MPKLLAMSFEGEVAPSFALRCLEQPSAMPDGWGLGYYADGEPAATVLKEAQPRLGGVSSELLRSARHLESSIFLLHVRRSGWGRNSDANTQPFTRAHGGRDWMLAHAGSLGRGFALSAPALFEPIGGTDAELVLCELLSRVTTLGARSLAAVPTKILREWMVELNQHGALDLAITDGADLVAYADARGEGSLHLWEIQPPYDSLVFGDGDIDVDLTRRGVRNRHGIVIASEPLASNAGPDAAFRRLAPGSLVTVRGGVVRVELEPGDVPFRSSATRMRGARPPVAEPATYEITHRTVYRYAMPVERSEHLLRLEPIHDPLQAVEEHTLSLSVDGQLRRYEDVFGNRVRHLKIDTSFTEMAIEARSRVRALDVDPLGRSGPHVRTALPVAWMPWQHQVLQPFLLSPELPDTELRELREYAMAFARRNDFDLLDTCIDINATLHKEYAYQPGVTTLWTTPFQTYVQRRGVCQDFANLFICLTRLLGVPSRYVCGYVHCGDANDNRAQGEASHAWVQVYLPEAGWRGFDPTNGSITQTEHVRVAVGRNYVDATPTSGTIFVGGGGETLSVDVRVTRLR